MRHITQQPPQRNTACSVCGKAINVGMRVDSRGSVLSGFKGQHTCGKSECQQEDCRRNEERVGLAKNRRRS